MRSWISSVLDDSTPGSAIGMPSRASTPYNKHPPSVFANDVIDRRILTPPPSSWPGSSRLYSRVFPSATLFEISSSRSLRLENMMAGTSVSLQTTFDINLTEVLWQVLRLLYPSTAG